MNYKPGGGNKPQPYIPAGNGEKSGQYTDSHFQQSNRKLCLYKNRRYKCNYMNSSLVKRVSRYATVSEHGSIPVTHRPNSVIKKLCNGYVLSERYYDRNGQVYLDIDYTDHGNPYTHPAVPHIHRWNKDKDGKIQRGKWEVFQ